MLDSGCGHANVVLMTTYVGRERRRVTRMSFDGREMLVVLEPAADADEVVRETQRVLVCVDCDDRIASLDTIDSRGIEVRVEVAP